MTKKRDKMCSLITEFYQYGETFNRTHIANDLPQIEYSEIWHCVNQLLEQGEIEQVGYIWRDRAYKVVKKEAA